MARATRLDLNKVLESLQQNGATGGLELRRSESNSEIAYAPLFETARSRVRLYRLSLGNASPRTRIASSMTYFIASGEAVGSARGIPGEPHRTTRLSRVRSSWSNPRRCTKSRAGGTSSAS